MQLIKSINLMENKKLIVWLNIWAGILIIPFLAIFTFIANTRISSSLTIEFSLGIDSIFWLLSFFLIIIIHELIHGLFFKIFEPKAKVQFGFKNGMAYAVSPDAYYSKLHFFIIGITPFIIITSILILMYFLGIIPKSSFISIAAIHATGCVGDFYWSYLLVRAPKNILINETKIGINFYIPNN